MTNSDSRCDRFCEDLARALAGRSTRRSVLGKAAGVLLGVLGFKFLPPLPSQAQAMGLAPAWMKCGAYGNLCGTNCGTGNDFTCPVNCPTGGYWRACCVDTSGIGWYIDYFDCFLASGAAPACPTKTSNMSGDCTDQKPLYRGDPPRTGDYCCSFVNDTGIPC